MYKPANLIKPKLMKLFTGVGVVCDLEHEYVQSIRSYILKYSLKKKKKKKTTEFYS